MRSQVWPSVEREGKHVVPVIVGMVVYKTNQPALPPDHIIHLFLDFRESNNHHHSLGCVWLLFCSNAAKVHWKFLAQNGKLPSTLFSC